MFSKGSTSSGGKPSTAVFFFANIYQVPTVCQALCSVLHAKGAEMSNRHACCQSSWSPGGRGHYYGVSFKGSMGVCSVEALHCRQHPPGLNDPHSGKESFIPKCNVAYFYPPSVCTGGKGGGVWAEHVGAVLVPHTSGAASSVETKRPHLELELFKGQPL